MKFGSYVCEFFVFNIKRTNVNFRFVNRENYKEAQFQDQPSELRNMHLKVKGFYEF